MNQVGGKETTITRKMDVTFFIKLEMPFVENEGGREEFPPVRLDLTNHCRNKRRHNRVK
jgi:hypothetical protein